MEKNVQTFKKKRGRTRKRRRKIRNRRGRIRNRNSNNNKTKTKKKKRKGRRNMNTSNMRKLYTEVLAANNTGFPFFVWASRLFSCRPDKGIARCLLERVTRLSNKKLAAKPQPLFPSPGTITKLRIAQDVSPCLGRSVLLCL